MSATAADRARAHFEAGEYRQAHEAALEGLAELPEDVELLLLAGRAGVELDDGDAVGRLRRATELAAESGEAWHYLGEALATEGRMDEANDAFRKAVERNPDDQLALTHLGHTSAATGHGEEALGYLAQAAERGRGASTAAISLVDLYRTLGQFDAALVQARHIASADPDDVIATLDVAELSLAVGQLDDAAGAFARLRDLDDVPGHEAYPLHGTLQVEIARENWPRALELAREAAATGAPGQTAGVVAFLAAQAGEPGEDEAPPPTLEQVQDLLRSSMAEYRRLHADDRRLSAEDVLG